MRDIFEIWQTPEQMKIECEKFFKANPSGSRQKVGVAKDIVEEAYSLALALSYVQAEEGALQCRLCAPNFRNDAEIKFENGNNVIEVQIVSGMPDRFHYEESMRMEYFEQHRHASMTGTVTADGTRNDPERKIAIEPIAISSAENSEKISKSVAMAIQRKAAKNELPDTWLLVWIDDWLTIKYFSRDQLDAFLKKIENASEDARMAFARVLLIGTSGAVFGEIGQRN